MKWFRYSLQKNRIFVLTLLSVCLFGMMDMRNYVYAYQEWEAKEKRLQEISEFLDVPVDQLRPDHETVYDRVKDLFGIVEEDPIKAAGMQRLQEVLRKHEEQLAANPYLPQIEKVKREHAPSRIEGMLRDVLQLTQPRHGKALPQGSQRALLRGLHYGMKDGLEESLELPIDENLPAKAQRKHAEFQAKLNQIMGNVKRVVDETQSDEMRGTLPQKVAQLSLKDATGLERKTRRSRYVDRGLPNQRVEKKSAKRAVQGDELSFTPQPVAPSKPAKSLQKSAIHQEILDLAESLDHTPSKIFSWVHDTIEVDPKWGATKSPVGTLREKLGTSWDQAWLLQELLIASGVDARLEWGEVQIDLDQLRDLTGVEDAWRAGDMMTTAGTPFVLLTQGNQPVAARMDHVWVKAHLDYVPRRAALPHGTGDTWVRMDPTIKQYNETEGIQLYDKVPFTLESYLLSGTTDSPRRVYEDAMWQYIRDNNIQCATLEQVKRARSIQTESFPFVPGSLRAKVVSVDGESATTPDAFQYQIAFDVRDLTGRSLLQWSSPWPAVYGKRIELAWPGATAEDQATLDAEGGVFETAPYLVDLKPSLRLDGLTAIDGQSIGSADDIEIYGNLTPPEGQATNVLFQGQAGERNVFAVDLGTTPQQRLDELQAALNAATEAANDAEAEANTLALIGATYMSILSRDLEDLAEWKWQRVLELGTFGTVIQSGDVQTTIGGSPLSFGKGPLVTDVATMPLGTFPADGTQGYGVETFELVGSQSSFLEGTALDMIVPDETMTAVTFLTRAARNGQQLQKVDSGNVESVLAAVDIGEAVEQEVREAVGQGKIAWVAESELQINQWRGSGYIIEDPSTGAAGYLGTGGYGVGSGTGGDPAARLKRLFGTESWLGPVDGILGTFFALIGLTAPDVPTSQYGDPINLSNGNMWFNVVDFSVLTTAFPVRHERFYNSQDSRVGWFGKGWTSSFEESVSEEGSDVIFLEADGTRHRFESVDTNSWQSPSGKSMSLHRDQEDGFEISYLGGLLKRFDNSGRLVAVTDRFGNGIAIDFIESAQIDVSDTEGRLLYRLSLLDGRVVEIEDILDRRVNFEYQGETLHKYTNRAEKVWTYTFNASGYLSDAVDPLGNTDSFFYDSEGRCVKHIAADGIAESISYGAGSAVVTDRGGFDHYRSFDERGRVLVSVEPLGSRQAVTWTGDNKVESHVDSANRTRSWVYNDGGNVTDFKDSDGLTYKIETNSFGQIERLEQKHPDGEYSLIENTYSMLGLLEERTISSSNVEPSVETFRFKPNGALEYHRSPSGLETTYVYEYSSVEQRNGLPTALRIGTEQIILNSDPAGRMVGRSSSEGESITSSLSPLDSVLSIQGIGESPIGFSYDELGRLRELTTSEGSRSLEYDSVGRVISYQNTEGLVMTQEFDALGNVVARRDYSGNTTRQGYDASGRVMFSLSPLGHLWSFEFCDGAGAPRDCGSECGNNGGSAQEACRIVDPRGGEYERIFDSNGSVIKMVDPLGSVTEIEYDEAGFTSKVTDPLGKHISYEYDEAGRLKSVLDQLSQRTEYTYDVSGNLTEVLDAENRIWKRFYDEKGRLTEERNPLGHSRITGYTEDGLIESIKDTRGVETIARYDGRSIEDIVTSDGRVIQTYDHDEQLRIRQVVTDDADLQFERDSLGRILKSTNVGTGTVVEYQYNETGLLELQRTDMFERSYLYDSDNNLVELSDSQQGTYRFSYDALGERKSLHYPNGAKQLYEYDAVGRLLSSITYGPGGDPIAGYSMKYDKRGSRTSMKDWGRQLEYSYAYDDLGRLKRYDSSSGEFEEYGYDAVGNRISLETQNRSVIYEYDDANRLISEKRIAGDTQKTLEYTWDGGYLSTVLEEGSASRHFDFDELGRLVSVENVGDSARSFQYDGFGNLVGSQLSGEYEEHFTNSHASSSAFSHQLVRDRGGAKTTYLQGPSTDEFLGITNDSGSYSFSHDPMRTIGSVMNEQAAIVAEIPHHPFGVVTDGAPEETGGLGFMGRPSFGDSGVSNFRARFYAPDQGRFISRDTWSGLSERPLSQNRFTFTENQPTLFSDPSGHSPSRGIRWVAGISLILSGIAGVAAIYGVLAYDLEHAYKVAKNDTTLLTRLIFTYIGSLMAALGAYFTFFTAFGFALIADKINFSRGGYANLTDFLGSILSDQVILFLTATIFCSVLAALLILPYYHQRFASLGTRISGLVGVGSFCFGNFVGFLYAVQKQPKEWGSLKLEAPIKKQFQNWGKIWPGL